MERTVSEVLRKMVRKYSSKRPEVVVVAVENPAAVLANEINGKLSGKSHINSEFSALRKAVDGHEKKRKPIDTLEEDNFGLALARGAKVQELEDQNYDERVQSEDEDASNSISPNGAQSTDESDDFWKSFVSSSVPNKLDSNSNLHLEVEERENAEDESSELESDLPKSLLKSSKTAKRNKWKQEEVKKLIKMRGELNSRFQVLKGRMALWEEISMSLLADGYSRSPGQCKSLWASLVQKYEETKIDTKSQKHWPYFEDVDNILSNSEATASK